MHTIRRVELFPPSELLGLQCDLQQADMDSLQATGLLAAFLNGRGYGVDPELVQESMVRLEESQCELDCMQSELERVALVM